MTCDEQLIEALADKEHASWARWMDYLFSKCLQGRTVVGAPAGSLVIPGDFVAHWKQEAATAYADLPERIKQSDRDEVAHILPIIQAWARKQVSGADGT